jgi:hypothetical protein
MLRDGLERIGTQYIAASKEPFTDHSLGKFVIQMLD